MKPQLKLREELRETCRIPLGVAIYREPEEAIPLIRELVQLVRPPMLISVGDFVTANLWRGGLRPDVAIVDMRVMRHASEHDVREMMGRDYLVLRCVNPPGTLTRDAMARVKDAVRAATRGAKALLIVDGEEDLLALPAIIFAPDRSVVVYGLWLGAAVAVICHPYVRRGVEKFMKEGFTEA
ncbi:MAG: hypothetical protein DRK00_00530 [Thermoprotei archaeon]|nr:MAG: hypothetical protein DRK00_00530 [Thermoprotei archaeon]